MPRTHSPIDESSYNDTPTYPDAYDSRRGDENGSDPDSYHHNYQPRQQYYQPQPGQQGYAPGQSYAPGQTYTPGQNYPQGQPYAPPQGYTPAQDYEAGRVYNLGQSFEPGRTYVPGQPYVAAPEPYRPGASSQPGQAMPQQPGQAMPQQPGGQAPVYTAPTPAYGPTVQPEPDAGTSAAATAATATDTAQPDVKQSAASRFIEGLGEKLRGVKSFRFLGVILFFLAAYAFVVCCSYFFTIGSDQSALLNGEPDPALYGNAGRKFGAIVAHALVYDWLGVGAFILIYYVGACALGMIGMWRPRFWDMTLRCLLAAVTLSVVAGLITTQIASPVYWGGMHGKILNERLIAYAGIWGAVAVSAALIGIMIVMYINEIRRAIRTTSGLTHAYSRFRSKRNARREERRLQIETNEEVRNLRAEIETLQGELEEARTAARTAAATQVAHPSVMSDVAESTPADEKETVGTADEERRNVTAGDAVKDNVTHADAADAKADAKASADSMPAAAAENPASVADVKPQRVKTDPAEMPLFPSPDPVADADDDGFDAPLFPSTPASPAVAAPARPRVHAHTEMPGEREELSPMTSPMHIDTADVAGETASAQVTPDEELPQDAREPQQEQHTVSPENERPADPRDQKPYDPRAELSNYRFPTLDLLRDVATRSSVDVAEMEENNARITKTLNDYGIGISHIKATVGPTVTLYEIVPAVGVRISKIKSLEDDIALNLAALGIRIIAPIPGRGTIGIEVPNKDPQTVSMRSVLDSEKYKTSHMDLPMAIGRTVSNEVFMADLTKMPHLLVAGATGMGKSVGLNAIIASLLYKKHPSELKFVMIDPKQVEFSLYAKLERHYLAKLPDEDDAIITDPLKVVATLNSLCVEMDNRYALLKDAQMRNIKEYNERFVQHRLSPAQGHRYMPYIVVIVDEFADLIMTAGKDVETPIARIAQKARAVGIHMILATQRPSTNVITGIIKANFPGRIAFRVFQMVDSRTILDRPGANQLIGRGDMLFSNNGNIERVQCAFIDTPEVTAMCDFIDGQAGYDHAYDLPEYVPENAETASVASVGDRDPLFDECARAVVSSDNASTSSLQRRYSIGYNRAGKIMDQMEAAGIVGPSQGGKPRQVLVDPLTLERILENK